MVATCWWSRIRPSGASLLELPPLELALTASRSCDRAGVALRGPSRRGSWIGTAFPADASGQAAAHAVNGDQRTGRIAQREEHSVPPRNAEIGGSCNMQP